MFLPCGEKNPTGAEGKDSVEIHRSPDFPVQPLGPTLIHHLSLGLINNPLNGLPAPYHSSLFHSPNHMVISPHISQMWSEILLLLLHSSRLSNLQRPLIMWSIKSMCLNRVLKDLWDPSDSYNCSSPFLLLPSTPIRTSELHTELMRLVDHSGLPHTASSPFPRIFFIPTAAWLSSSFL